MNFINYNKFNEFSLIFNKDYYNVGVGIEHISVLTGLKTIK